MISRQKLIEDVSKLPVKPCEDGNFVGLGAVLQLIESQPPADVPDTNVGEITKAQAIEALETLKTYCDQFLRENGVIADYERSCDECPLDDWCWYDREHLTPDDWQIPQERTEE